MNGYQAFAETYANLAQKEPEEQIRKALLQRSQAFRTVATCSDTDLCLLFDTGAFNDILKGYLMTAAADAKLDEETTARLTCALSLALEDMSALDAVNFLKKSQR